MERTRFCSPQGTAAARVSASHSEGGTHADAQDCHDRKSSTQELDASGIPHTFPFDPTQGYNLPALLQVGVPENEPRDFDDFWWSLRRETEGNPLELVVSEEADAPAGFRLWKLGYAIGRGYRSSAWLSLPTEAGSVHTGVVVSHGYGGRNQVEAHFFRQGMAVVLPVAPGFGISADARLPLNEANHHVVFGIESPETYVLGLCAAAIWRALDATQAVLGRELPRWHYIGWSFGGGMGALSLPWEPRIGSAELGQPTFGNHPLRLLQPSTGSSNAVRERFLRDPGILRTLGYFDSAFAACRLQIPTAFACAIFDPAVTPPGQFAVANAHPGPKRITSFLTGHFLFSGHDETPQVIAHRQAVQELIGPEFAFP